MRAEAVMRKLTIQIAWGLAGVLTVAVLGGCEMLDAALILTDCYQFGVIEGRKDAKQGMKVLFERSGPDTPMDELRRRARMVAEHRPTATLTPSDIQRGRRIVKGVCGPLDLLRRPGSEAFVRGYQHGQTQIRFDRVVPAGPRASTRPGRQR
jgi:hypothetical protein